MSVYLVERKKEGERIRERERDSFGGKINRKRCPSLMNAVIASSSFSLLPKLGLPFYIFVPCALSECSVCVCVLRVMYKVDWFLCTQK